MKLFHLVTLILVVLGGINWTLFGLMDLNLITQIFGTGGISTLIYVLVTIATLYHVLPKLMTHVQTVTT